MARKKCPLLFVSLIVSGAVMGVVFSGCATTPDYTITVNSVHVDSDSVAFAGQSNLPNGTCLETQLYADGDPETWWPMDTCVVVQDGAWQITVPLGEEGAPDKLDPTVEYRVRVWQRDNPAIESVFYFDLAGPPLPLIEMYATCAKNAYLPGDEVEIEFKFKNVRTEPITLTPFPPRIQVTRPRSDEVVRSFSIGSEDLNLEPGETAEYTLVWNQKDNNGQQVAPGWYYVGLIDVTITKATVPTTSHQWFGCAAEVLIQFPQGAMEKTVEVNQSQTVDGITITLKRLELFREGAKFYAFATSPDYSLPHGPNRPPPEWDVFAWAKYTIDGAIRNAGSCGIRHLEDGVELTWGSGKWLDPVPSDAKELTFTITKFGDWQGPWEFHIPL